MGLIILMRISWNDMNNYFNCFPQTLISELEIGVCARELHCHPEILELTTGHLGTDNLRF
jgi:hypothetical protein